MEPSRRLTVNRNVTALFPPQGRFTIAAKHHITIAEIYETELVDIEKVRRWGKLVGGDPRRPCSGDARAEGSMCSWGLLETSGGGGREKPLTRAPGCLCSDLGQHLCKTEHCGQQTRIREEWLVLLVVDAELERSPSSHACFRPGLLSLSLPVSPLSWPLEHVLPGALTPARGCFLLFSGGWALMPSLPSLPWSSVLTQLHGMCALCLAAACPRQQ